MFLVREIEEVTEKVTFGQRFKGDERANHENTWVRMFQAEGAGAPSTRRQGVCQVWVTAARPGWDEGDQDREQRENAGRSFRPCRPLEGL